MMNLGQAVNIMVQSPVQREVETLFIQHHPATHHLHCNPPTNLCEHSDSDLGES